MMVKYYAQRAKIGLIIAEVTMAIEGNFHLCHERTRNLFFNSNYGIEKIIRAIHEKGVVIPANCWDNLASD
jgi:2,4-dienoyl-CoA reductase-like NADH-dependent reductase (Old Yellow Enzyme family)